MSLSGTLLLAAILLACFLLWRILRTLEWLAMFALGVRDSLKGEFPQPEIAAKLEQLRKDKGK